jgi:ABC-type molybdate transport system substrate-binding protein
MKAAAQLLIFIMAAISSDAIAADALIVYAAGSLRSALVDMGQDFESKTGTAVKSLPQGNLIPQTC